MSTCDGDGAATLDGESEAALGPTTTRRRLLQASGLGLIGATTLGLAGCSLGGDDEKGSAAASGSTTGGSSNTSSGGSILDKWTREKKARLGVDLSFPPLQFKDENGTPSGYIVEITNKMMKELGVEVEYVQTPFAQLFAGLSAGKFDMLGIAATILPSRALRGWFADVPTFYESNVVLVKKGSGTTYDDLENAKVTVLQGSSQAANAATLFPNASFRELASANDAATEVAVERADATITSEFSVADAIKSNSDLEVLDAPPLFVDANAYLMPEGDTKLWLWVSNWMRYEASHRTFEGLWRKWVVPDTQKYDLTTAVVGINGEAVPVS
ncbi:MAG: amino acid ABC transporter substrate-binding protein [Actinobacteria bacterium]|nr:amino acid ABC transporter substrate-binding protein [Actinomycetota bacterium]